MGGGALFFLLCVLCSVFCALEVKAEPRVPEKFVYYIYWSGIRAGMATFDFEDTADGVTIKTHATSASFISVFYKVDDIAQSVLYRDGYPSVYTLKIREGRHKRDKVTRFGKKPVNGLQKIVYNNLLDNEKKEFDVEKQAFDPLSGFYNIRKRQLKAGHSEHLDIFDSKKLWNIEVQVIGKERISTPAGEFDTIIIKPLMQSEGIFMRKGEIYIWLTDDDKKIPVMIKSEIKVGSFVAKLAEGAY
jgi:hypothetical protein